MKANGYVVEFFNVPSVAPKPVLEAKARYDKLSADLQKVTGQWDRAVRSRADDIAAANRAQATARMEGTKSDFTPTKVEQNLAKLKAERDVLLEAVDLAGNQLIATCEEHREEWLAMLDKIDEDATERLRVALGNARQALEDLQIPRTAPGWVRNFSARRALMGDQIVYHESGIGGHQHLDNLDEIVNPKPVLVGYIDGEAIWEDQMVGRESRPAAFGRKRGISHTTTVGP
jgi:hypothetical protein